MMMIHVNCSVHSPSYTHTHTSTPEIDNTRSQFFGWRMKGKNSQPNEKSWFFHVLFSTARKNSVVLLFDVSVVVFFIILSHVPFENRFFVSDHGSIVILPGILFLCVFFLLSRFVNRNVLCHPHSHSHYFRFGCWPWIMNEKCKVKLNIV